mmetsp:Transcript_23974/g.56639  ORF Transcript_23974/g.56639 Transcript_23974/m.56639 type:complete len:141 (+) Transcript_23974:874-1296(+)
MLGVATCTTTSTTCVCVCVYPLQQDQRRMDDGQTDNEYGRMNKQQKKKNVATFVSVLSHPLHLKLTIQVSPVQHHLLFLEKILLIHHDDEVETGRSCSSMNNDGVSMIRTNFSLPLLSVKVPTYLTFQVPPPPTSFFDIV